MVCWQEMSYIWCDMRYCRLYMDNPFFRPIVWAMIMCIPALSHIGWLVFICIQVASTSTPVCGSSVYTVHPSTVLPTVDMGYSRNYLLEFSSVNNHISKDVQKIIENLHLNKRQRGSRGGTRCHLYRNKPSIQKQDNDMCQAGGNVLDNYNCSSMAERCICIWSSFEKMWFEVSTAASIKLLHDIMRCGVISVGHT